MPRERHFTMSECRPRLAGALVGDIYSDPGARTKYGYFFKALRAHFPLVDVYDATLRGGYRYLNALRTFHPDRRQWRERFYKNVSAFRLRSRLAGDYFQKRRAEIDLTIQLGVLFDAHWYPDTPPTLIYTDYTAQLAAQRPFSGRSPFSEEGRRRWLDLERDAFRKASHICCRSELVRRSIIEDYGIQPGQVTVIGGGVNFASLPPAVPARATSRPTVLFIGKELYRKGGDILLEAFARVRHRIPHAQLRMVTEDPLPDGAPRDGVEIIRPTWDREAIAEQYLAADVFVLPSRLETWGDVLLEAMSFGLPCVGVTGQAMEEILEHDVSGLIVPEEDVESLGATLFHLLNDVDLRDRLGQAARRQAEEHFRWSDVARRLGVVIRETGVYE